MLFVTDMSLACLRVNRNLSFNASLKSLFQSFGELSGKGLIAIADCEKNCILICDEDGKIVRHVGCKGEKPGQLSGAGGVTFINDDEILVADQWNHRVQQFNAQSAPSFVNSFGRLGTEDGNFRNPA